MGVDSGDEDRRGFCIGGGYLAERPRAQRGPLATLQQLLTDGAGIERPRLAVTVAVEGLGFVAVDLDHDRLQHSPGAAVDGADHPGRR